MPKYKFICFTKRENKEKTKSYNLINIALITDTNCDIISILVTPEQIEKLNKLLLDRNYDISQNIVIEYNSYTKNYAPIIKV